MHFSGKIFHLNKLIKMHGKFLQKLNHSIIKFQHKYAANAPGRLIERVNQAKHKQKQNRTVGLFQLFIFELIHVAYSCCH